MALKRQAQTIIPDAPVFGGVGRAGVTGARRGPGRTRVVDRRDIGGAATAVAPKRTIERSDIFDLLITRRQLDRQRRFILRGETVIQRAPMIPAVIPKVRSRPAPTPGAGLLPANKPTEEPEMATFFESLGDVAVDYARAEFLGTGGTSPAGTVVEFPTTFVPQIGTDNGLVAAPKYVKRRRRRRRLLTASDKCDIAAMKAMLNTAEFKIWLACPSMFKG